MCIYIYKKFTYIKFIYVYKNLLIFIKITKNCF